MNAMLQYVFNNAQQRPERVQRLLDHDAAPDRRRDIRQHVLLHQAGFLGTRPLKYKAAPGIRMFAH